MVPSPPTAKRKRHRTWPQRLTLVVVVTAAVACFAAAGSIAAGQWVLWQRNLAPLAETTSEGQGASDPDIVVPDPTSGVDDAGQPLPTLPDTPGTEPPLVLAEPEAAN